MTPGKHPWGLYWARLRTRIRNRVHAPLDRQPQLSLPQCSDFFGVCGMSHLRKLRLAEPDHTLLQEDLALMDVLNHQIKDQEKRIAAQSQPDEDTRLLQSIPGFGPIFGSIIAAEIDGIERFGDSAHLCACAGLVPTTYASGGHVSRGSMLPACNHWLRWAFIEGARNAIKSSAYFGSIYQHHRARGKQARAAMVVVAHRMCQIVYCLLKERRPFQTHPIQHHPKEFFPVASTPT